MADGGQNLFLAHLGLGGRVLDYKFLRLSQVKSSSHGCRYLIHKLISFNDYSDRKYVNNIDMIIVSFAA